MVKFHCHWEGSGSWKFHREGSGSLFHTDDNVVDLGCILSWYMAMRGNQFKFVIESTVIIMVILLLLISVSGS